jgi:integrase
MPKPTKPSKGPYERSDSPYWWVSYVDASGKRVRRSTGIPRSLGAKGKREAEALLGKWQAEIHQQRLWGKIPEKEPSSVTFDDVMLAYFQDRVSTQRSGFRRAKATAKHLYLAFTNRPMASLADRDVKAYVRQRMARGAAPGTINKEITMLCAACNHARNELGWDIPNPAAGRGKKLREPAGRVRWLEREEAVRLIRVTAGNRRAPWLADFVQLALNTGCRAGELLGLEWARVDLRSNLFFLEEAHTKAKKRRSVPLNDSAREAILSRARFRAEHCPASPWVFCKKDGSRLTSLRRSFRSACAAAGIEDFRIHDQRHTLASWLVKDAVPLAEVRDVLGHSSVKVTERYAHLHPENVRQAVGRIVGVSLRHDLVTDGSVSARPGRRKPLK